MLDSFRWNLRVLSYVSLAVGAFLIYNTISVSVVRRRFEIGILRALGTPRAAILAGILGEASCFGLLGGIAGIVLGRVMSEGAVKLVASTVASLYFSSQPGANIADVGNSTVGHRDGRRASLWCRHWDPLGKPRAFAPVEAMARGRREHQVRVHRWRSAAAAVVLAAIALDRCPAKRGATENHSTDIFPRCSRLPRARWQFPRWSPFSTRLPPA